MSLQSAGFTYSCLITLITVCHVTAEFSSVYPPSQFNSERDVYVDKPMDIACFDNNEVIQFSGGSLSSQNMTWRSLYNYDKIITNKEGDVVTVTDQSYLRVSAGANQTDSGAYVCEFRYSTDTTLKEFVSYHLVRLHVMVKPRYGLLFSFLMGYTSCDDIPIQQLTQDLAITACNEKHLCEDLVFYKENCKIAQQGVYEVTLSMVHYGTVLPDLPSPQIAYKCLTMGIHSLYKCRVYDSIQHLIEQKDNVIGDIITAIRNHSDVTMDWAGSEVGGQVVARCPEGTVFRKKSLIKREKLINGKEEENGEIFCVGCLPGTVAPGGLDQRVTECHKCPENMYQERAASTFCLVCPNFSLMRIKNGRCCNITPEGSAKCVSEKLSDCNYLSFKILPPVEIMIVVVMIILVIIFIDIRCVNLCQRYAKEPKKGHVINLQVNVSHKTPASAVQVKLMPEKTRNNYHDHEQGKEKKDNGENEANDRDQHENNEKNTEIQIAHSNERFLEV